jgi:predicted AlkP superfamily phosphohydrolase/phosphomutase
MRSVIFGVDGLTFRILHPMMERGELPNFRRLRQLGCEAVLESKYPPLTPPAWTSLSTGLKPARHGVYDFWTYDQDHAGARDAHVQTRRKAGKAIWNILSDFGKQVLVINVPMTYPPEAVNGVMISGYMTPSVDSDFTYPKSFKEELFQVVPDYQIDLDYSNIWVHPKPKALELLIDATLRMTERRIALTMHLLKEKPWDFCYVAFVGPDRLQHPLWQRIIALEGRATEYFRLLDQGLGLVLEQLGSDDSLFVVSDHGFQGAPRLFDINQYLYSKKLFAPNATYQASSTRSSAALKRTLEQVGLLSLARKTKRALGRAGIAKSTVHDQQHYSALSVIDWERSLACVPSHSGFGGGYADIFLSDDLSAEGLTELCADLKRQVDPRSGKPLVDALYTTEVYGTGPFAPTERHLIVLPSDGITFRVTLGNRRLWDDPNVVRGTHQKDGVLYAYGGGIKQGFSAPNAEIYDLVPTVLRSMGLPLPIDFDGRVLDELFVESKQAEQAALAAGTASGGGLARRRLGKLLGD